MHIKKANFLCVCDVEISQTTIPPSLLCTWYYWKIQLVCIEMVLEHLDLHCQISYCVATPLWAKCEDETHTPKSGNLESSETPAILELNSKGKNTLPWGVLYTVGKVLKCRCPKWFRMSHLDIYSPSYGQKKGRESNWQFDSRPLKVRNRPDSDVYKRSGVGKILKRATRLLWTSSQLEVWARSYGCPKSRESNPRQFRDSSLGVLGKSVIRM